MAAPGAEVVCALAIRAAFQPRKLASALHITLRDLERLFQATHGLPPRTLLRRWRSTFAVALLEAGVPAKQVAAELGYCDPSHLHRELGLLEDTTPHLLQACRRRPDPAGPTPSCWGM